MAKYIPRTREEKMQYAKRFSKGERESYRKGVRQGFLQGIHKRKYADKVQIKGTTPKSNLTAYLTI